MAAWIGLIGVALGGLIGLIGPWIRSSFERRAAREIELRERRVRLGIDLVKAWMTSVMEPKKEHSAAWMYALTEWQIWAVDERDVAVSRLMSMIAALAQPMAREQRAGKLAGEVVKSANAWIRRDVTPELAIEELRESAKDAGLELTWPPRSDRRG